MAKRSEEGGQIWWLARGSSSRTRQPSFAPPTARPVISYSSYGFGWHRGKNCFITSSNHDPLSSTNTKEHPCDTEVALGILRRCSYKGVSDRFFNNPYAKDDDADIFSSSGHMFGISLKGMGEYNKAEATLHFYAPDGKRQFIGLHSGMTVSFGRIITGLKVGDIREQMS